LEKRSDADGGDLTHHFKKRRRKKRELFLSQVDKSVGHQNSRTSTDKPKGQPRGSGRTNGRLPQEKQKVKDKLKDQLTAPWKGEWGLTSAYKIIELGKLEE